MLVPPGVINEPLTVTPGQNPVAQNALIWTASVIIAIKPTPAQNGGSRSGLRLRSVTNYGRELPPGGRGRQAEECQPS